MRLSCAERDKLLRHADEIRTRLRRGTLELMALGDRLLAGRNRADALRPG